MDAWRARCLLGEEGMVSGTLAMEWVAVHLGYADGSWWK